MIRSWKRRLVGGIALGMGIVLGSSLVATSLRADSNWSWGGTIIGGVIGGLIGSTHDSRTNRLATVTVTTALAPYYDGPFVVHHHHGGWHRHPRQHRRGWQVWLGHPDPWYVHHDRYHHRQWHGPRVHGPRVYGPRVQLRTSPTHLQGRQYHQAHGQRAHQQPRHTHVQRHQHRHGHGHGHQAHQQTRHTHTQVHRHGHAHRW